MHLVDKMKSEVEKVASLSAQVNDLETKYHTQLKETAAKHSIIENLSKELLSVKSDRDHFLD